MYAGTAISVVAHIAMLAWAFWSIQMTPELVRPDVPTIEAELITIAEFTRLKQGDPTAKKLEAKKKEAPDTKVAKREAPKPKPVAAKPPPAPEPPPPTEPVKTEPPPPKSDPIADKLAALTPPPPNAPTGVEKKKLEEERRKKAAKKAREEAKKKKAAEKKRKERLAKKKKKKKKDLAKSIHALLDKTPEPRGAPRASSDPTNPTDYTGPTAGERQGSGTLLSAREEDLLKSQIDGQIRACWRLPGGGGGIETTTVVLSWRLNRDGSLSGQPQVVNGRSDPLFKIAVEAAIRAVNCAAPFSLPQDKYDAWKFVRDWAFDPSHML